MTTDTLADIHIGNDGWLFLIGGSNNVLEYYTSKDHFSDETLGAWVRLVRERLARARTLGCTYQHIVVPEKLTVYPEYFALPLPGLNLVPTHRLPSALAAEPDGADLYSAYVDLLPLFDIQKRNGIKLYWKTDTHWTFEGAFSAYQLLCYKLAAKTNDELLKTPHAVGKIPLDLGSKLTPPVVEEFISKRLITNAKRIYANPLVTFKEQHGRENDGGLHVGSHVIFSNERRALDNRRLVLFGDSFAEYRDVLLTGLLAETFAETHFIWSAQIDWRYVERIRPDILVTELAERFMNQVPHDQFDLEQFASERLPRDGHVTE